MKRNYLLASLLAIAAAFTGCSQDDETIGTNPLQTYKGEVNASLEDVLGDSNIEGPGTRAMFIGGNSGNRFANVWDAGDKILVYKDGVKVSPTAWQLDDDENNPNNVYQGTKEAYFSGELEGSFAVGDQVQLYVTQGTNLARSYTGQDGTIGKLSKDYSFRNATVSVSKITGTTIKMSRAAMWHSQAYLRFYLKDENNQRLHLQKLVISSTGDNKIITKVAANGTVTTGNIVVNTTEYRGEYPGEIYVAILNQGYTVDAETGAVTNGSVGAYQLTAVDDKGTVYVFPGPEEVLDPNGVTGQKPIKVNPTIGSLTNIERKMSKGTPVITLPSQKTLIVGRKSPRKAKVTIGAVDISDNCTVTYSSNNTAVATVNETTGEVTAVGAGEATITATLAGTANYNSNYATYTVTVYESIPEDLYAVDLGLPSGTKWATMNVGAANPWDEGTYFAWGETEGFTDWSEYDKNSYEWDTYKFGTENSLTKYNSTDRKMKMDYADDAARVNWGGNWEIPTWGDFAELRDNTRIEHVQSGNMEFNGKAGWKVISTVEGYTDKFIFLPTTGAFQIRYGFGHEDVIMLWINNLYGNKKWGYRMCRSLNNQNSFSYDGVPRANGYPVRAIVK